MSRRLVCDMKGMYALLSDDFYRQLSTRGTRTRRGKFVFALTGADVINSPPFHAEKTHKELPNASFFV
jgi:hypothetical protein